MSTASQHTLECSGTQAHIRPLGGTSPLELRTCTTSPNLVLFFDPLHSDSELTDGLFHNLTIVLILVPIGADTSRTTDLVHVSLSPL